MKRVHSMSCFLKWSALAICLALPLIEAGYWITNGYPFLQPFFKPQELVSFGNQPTSWASLDDLQKFLGFLVNLIPMGFYMLALAFLAKVFYGFEQGKIFERENMVLLKRTGWMLIWGQITYPLYFALLSLTLTYKNPVGERMISVAIGWKQIELLLIGLVIVLTAWIFKGAVQLQEEQEGTV